MKAKLLFSVIFLVVILILSFESVYACNQAPEAELRAFREYVILGNSVVLDGSDSYDSDGSITEYKWDFTNNSSYDYTETSTSYPDGAFDGKTTYIYDSNGTYTAKLRVKDNGDLTDTDTCYVYVSEDSDNDNLPGGWEEVYGLDDSNSLDADEDLDSDG